MHGHEERCPVWLAQEPTDTCFVCGAIRGERQEFARRMLNQHRAGAVFMLPVRAILALPSGEAQLICEAGHIAGHPKICSHGCDILPIVSGTVSDVIGYKPSSRGRRNAKPLFLEDGWLVNGHHRVAYACEQGIPALPVKEVIGVLAEQRVWHQTILRECQERRTRRSDSLQR